MSQIRNPIINVGNTSDETQRKPQKIEVKLKSVLRQFQLSLDIDDMLIEKNDDAEMINSSSERKQSSFIKWIQICIIKPYGYRIPHTIHYLVKKLEIEDDQEIQFLLSNFLRHQESFNDKQ